MDEFSKSEDMNGENCETALETRAKRASPITLTFTRRASGGFTGKRLNGLGKVEMFCRGPKFVDEVIACADFDHVAAAISERARTRDWAISLGTPARNPSGPHSHDAASYLDTPTRLFFVDFDGVFANGLGRADMFENAAAHVLSLMGKAFEGVACLALRTTRTGSDEDRIFIRLLFLLDAPVTLVQMGAVATKLSELPAFTQGVVKPQKTTIDIRLYKEGRFIFITAPQCLPGVMDPAAGVSYVKAEGKTLELEEAAKALGVDLASVSAKRRATRIAGVTASDKRRVSPIAPGPRNQELLTALVQSIPNDGAFDNRDRTGAVVGEGTYLGMAHAIFGACSSEPDEFGRNLWPRWAARWHLGGDPAKDERVWDTLPNGVNGFWDLMDYARVFGGAAGTKARWDIFEEINPLMSAEQLDDLARAHVGEIPDWVLEMNAEYAFGRDRPGGVIVRGDGASIIRMLTRQELRNICANDLIQVSAGKNKDGSPKTRFVNKGDAWFSHRARAQYRGVGAYPVGREPPGTLNLWKGLATAPRPGEWPLLKAFLFDIICGGSPATFDYLLKLDAVEDPEPDRKPQGRDRHAWRSGDRQGDLGRHPRARIRG